MYLALYFYSTGLSPATGMHFPDTVLVMNQKLSDAELNTQPSPRNSRTQLRGPRAVSPHYRT